MSADGAHKYSVLITREGTQAMVVINQEKNNGITAKVELPNAGRLVVATPEQPESQPTSGTIRIPARSAAVIMEP